MNSNNINEVKSIMIVGVGGQGTLLASRILGNAILAQNYDVKVSEVHGMSQRGGSVVTYVRFGKEVCSPVIDEGQADIIVSFEQLEAARWLKYLKKGGKLITSTQKIDPMPVITGAATYPNNLIEQMKEKGIDLVAVDALSLAEEAGSSKATNVVLMGVLSNYLDFEDKFWEDAINQCVPSKFLDVNRKAFTLGEMHR
ncbi:indolepyruvate oxidoreductase subunit beta [Paludicola sp. MB14-C6]|uniref:indolepyruvate oxidoreductase subunit beta n=1 Tax=Paludihabitans sp. MB14-C6 TaxID=3070656 RepID=UPI0027DCC0CF|nr:indolepyruvate oxidoreductase subunit beta [Paludicola sp. MB14-C6]WMJ23413.1 indolepyruvate oxidoreductase subunit beta [Paludicola sp. MB14-C6]